MCGPTQAPPNTETSKKGGAGVGLKSGCPHVTPSWGPHSCVKQGLLPPTRPLGAPALFTWSEILTSFLQAWAFGCSGEGTGALGTQGNPRV